MKLPLAAALTALVFAASCGSEAAEPAPPTDPAAQLETMKVAIAELMERSEDDVDRVEVQQILVTFAGATERIPSKRLRPDAESLAAELYCRLVSGEEIDQLVRDYSDDSAPGIAIINQERPMPGEVARSLLSPDVGNVSWRLEVGEVGVVPYHPKLSPFGWFIIKRLN